VVLKRAPLFVAATAILLGCSAPEPPPPSGGSDAGAGKCGRGVVVVDSDFKSTNISLVGLDGAVLSPSFISSASTTTGLSAPLSGDVVAPTMPAAGADVVLIDRYPAGVLTFVDAKTAKVGEQIDVKTGFASNPQDYAAIDAHRAYVSRYDPNRAPGHQKFDGGSDVLVVDPSSGAISARIDLDATLMGEKGFFPRPNRIVVAGDRAYVLLSAYAADFQSAAESRVVTLDTTHDVIEDVTILKGLYGCLGLSLSPSGDALAVACSGTFHGSSSSDVAQAGVVLLDRQADLKELGRASADELGGDPLGFSVAFTAERAVLVTSFGTVGGDKAHGDRVVLLDLDAGTHRDVLSTALAFKLGEVRCEPACGVCFVADGEDKSSLLRFEVGGGALAPETKIAPDPAVGLPAFYLGAF
jgi:hypothetical protein